MRKTAMDVLMFSIFVSQVLHIFGNVTVLRGSLTQYYGQNARKLICFSSDDDGALVWNDNSTWDENSQNSYTYITNSKFQYSSKFHYTKYSEIDCKMNAYDNCLELWTKEKWYLTNSIETPMGPVFDQRWEEFQEYNFCNITQDINLEITAVGALSFSTRALHDAHVLLCNGKNYETSYCYWIIIGGWKNTISTIRKCKQGVQRPWPKEGSECYKFRVSHNHSPLSGIEWRSFLITWNFWERNISVYDNDNVIMTYVDKERFENSSNYYVFAQSTTKILFRFHIYNFLYTTDQNAILTSPIFRVEEGTACILLLIGLCAQCNADVMLRDSTTNEELKIIKVKSTSNTTIHGLPMWQSVKIKKNFLTSNYVDLQLIPYLNTFNSNPLWAIANVRQCPPEGSFRIGTTYVKQNSYRSGWTWHYYWPIVTCQRLFYNKHTVVNALSNTILNVEPDDVSCPYGMIGPQCSIFCQYKLDSNDDCKEVVICYRDGCICSPGFIGPTCSQYCKSNTYGHNCKKTCGSCKTSCNPINGICNGGCYNQIEKLAKLYLPPLCQINANAQYIDFLQGIDKPSLSEITSTKTTIQATVPIAWKDEYNETIIHYSFTIKKGNDDSIYQKWNRIFQNMTQLVGYFENLKPGTPYQIRCTLQLSESFESVIFSDWQHAETDCDPVEGFDVTPQEKSIVIDWQKNSNLYPCPGNWYYLIIWNVDMDEQVFNNTPNYFPYGCLYLTSYTSYNVTIFHKDHKLFFQKIRTLEGVPSRVSNLQSIVFNTNVTIIWGIPNQPNGEIVRYEVILKVEEYLGCNDLGLATPNNHTTTKSTRDTKIAFPDLHPYASYSAQVTAYNSRHASIGAKTIFHLPASDIPAEVVSNLRMRDLTLYWDPPQDCSTITGPIKIRINIRGISDMVREFNVTKQTGYNYYHLYKLKSESMPLYGAEQYVATLYIIRHYGRPENASAYQKYKFETPPKAPPAVTNLNVVEVDTRQTPARVHLRWQSPLPPLNGKLNNYVITLCKKQFCNRTEIKLSEFCDLWDDYICGIIEKSDTSTEYISVLAYNMNITEPSPPTNVTDKMLKETKPDPPGNFTFTMNNNSVIDLKWHHPWKTNRHLQCFRIQIREFSSDLRKRVPRSSNFEIQEYLVTHYNRTYSKSLYLLPSTQYYIYIEAITISNESSKTKQLKIHTPSTKNFDGDLEIMVQKSDSTISLNIPFVLNDTLDSIMHIIVKGPNPCDQHSEVPESIRKQAGVRMYDIAWQAAEIMTNEFAGKIFTVGDDHSYGGAKNCPLKPEELYEIVVIVTEQNSESEPITLTASIRIGESSPKHHEAWIIPIILFLAVASIVFYFYRRRKQQSVKQLMLQDEMVLSHNIENYEHETKFAISDSKQDLSNSSNRQSLSSEITPEIPPIAITTDGKEMTSLVKVKDFEDYVKEAIQLGSLDKQYETFPRGQTRPWDYGKLPQNKTKNRYGNLIAYDDTRVILQKLPDDVYSDYINANYITGYKKEKHYIATQGPKPNTVVDFWRMIWQENVLIICMLANVIENGKTKCEQYWPDIGKKKKYGDIIVLNSKHNVFADYCFRTFQITYGEETRKIEHLHYTAWPDHGVPLYTHSVVTYLKKLLATPPGNGPVVVHCSAGVGRTGTIILCDICLHRAAAEGLIDVFAETASIRSERANMVDNKQQYLLAHLALVECLLSIPTTLPCNEVLPMRIKELKKQLPIQQNRLQNIAWQDEALRQITSPLSLSERNRAKNRYPELILDKISRIYLKRCPASDEDSDYLSAIYVDGVKQQNQYLATQLPMPLTINDFWRMIAEFKVELILMLQPPDPQDSTCCAIAPMSGEFKPMPYLTITGKKIVELEYYTSQKFLLVDNSEKPSREQSVTILCLTEWKPGRNQPPPPVMAMITFWQAAERIARGDGPTVIICHDGVTGCGLYLAMSFLLERMAVERECDVCLAVRAVRRSRPDFVRSLEHLEYLYDAAVTYLEYFETYANFS